MYRLRSAHLRPFLSALCLVFAIFTNGCTSPQPSSAPARASGGSEPVPSWVGRKLSWSKLEEIEAWQASSRSYESPYWRTEGELQLAEGRLAFAENAIAGAGLEGRGHDRLQKARAGFERVLASSDASSAQRTRARTGSNRCRDLLNAPATTDRVAAGTVVTRGDWGARPARPSNMDRSKSGWRRITVHHSAMSDPIPLSGSKGDSSTAVRRIQRAHMETSGYGDIGYHFLIDPWGRVFQGRELLFQGAHAGGSNNVGNIGICLIGNFDTERPTTAALDTLGRLIDGLRSKYRIPAGNLVAHSDLKSTNCPGRNLRPWVERYRGAIAKR